jgi:hypothetical protein
MNAQPAISMASNQNRKEKDSRSRGRRGGSGCGGADADGDAMGVDIIVPALAVGDQVVEIVWLVRGE